MSDLNDEETPEVSPVSSRRSSIASKMEESEESEEEQEEQEDPNQKDLPSPPTKEIELSKSTHKVKASSDTIGKTSLIEKRKKRAQLIKEKRLKRAQNTEQLPGGGRVSDAYAFTGMHHIWDEHHEAGNQDETESIVRSY